MNNIYRVALFLPSITSTVAVSMVWLWIFNPDMGLINNFLMAIGLNDVPMWLGDTAWSKPALVIMRVWQMGGYYMIMFLAGLQTIRGERKAIKLVHISTDVGSSLLYCLLGLGNRLFL